VSFSSLKFDHGLPFLDRNHLETYELRYRWRRDLAAQVHANVIEHPAGVLMVVQRAVLSD